MAGGKATVQSPQVLKRKLATAVGVLMVGGAVASANLAAATGSALVGFTQGGAGAVMKSAEVKMRETMSLGDFGVIGDGVADDTAAINAAFSYAAEKKAALHGVPGVFRCTSSIIVKSGLLYLGNHGGLFVQDYEYIVGPKQESLFVNESYDNNAALDDGIHLCGLNIENADGITTGSFISINRCENYSITNLKAVKTSANGTLNISGKNVYLDNINIDSLSPSGLNSDGIHFEYLEGALLSNLRIRSQDDCLGFAYFPIIDGNPNNGPAGRDKPSRNISVVNALLESDLANGIRVGNTTLLGIAVDDLISPAARYEWLTFTNIIFNKVGVTGSCIELYDIRSNAEFPSSEIRFNGCIFNDSTSATRSMIRIVGNDYLSGSDTYVNAGQVRNYDRIFFSGISGRHSNAGQTINAGGVKYLSLVDFQVQRTATADNEILTNLVDDIYIKSSVVNSIPLSGTSNSIYCIDFDKLRIDGTDILDAGGANAAVQIARPNKGNGGELMITGSAFAGHVDGVKAVSPLVLDSLQIDVNASAITGSIRNANLTALVSDLAPMSGLHANISTVSANEARRTNNIAILNLMFVTTAEIAAGVTYAIFPDGMKPVNATAVRFVVLNSDGTAYQSDYSSGANLRSQSAMPAGTYFINLAYHTDA